jgi:hypothetical protein
MVHCDQFLSVPVSGLADGTVEALTKRATSPERQRRAGEARRWRSGLVALFVSASLRSLILGFIPFCRQAVLSTTLSSRDATYSDGSMVTAITIGAVSSGPLTNSIRSILPFRFGSIAR